MFNISQQPRYTLFNLNGVPITVIQQLLAFSSHESNFDLKNLHEIIATEMLHHFNQL